MNFGITIIINVYLIQSMATNTNAIASRPPNESTDKSKPVTKVSTYIYNMGKLFCLNKNDKLYIYI